MNEVLAQQLLQFMSMYKQHAQQLINIICTGAFGEVGIIRISWRYSLNCSFHIGGGFVDIILVSKLRRISWTIHQRAADKSSHDQRPTDLQRTDLECRNLLIMICLMHTLWCSWSSTISSRLCLIHNINLLSILLSIYHNKYVAGWKKASKLCLLYSHLGNWVRPRGLHLTSENEVV